MPRDNIPESRAERLQGKTEDMNADDRTALAREHGIPADTGTADASPRHRTEREDVVTAARGPEGRRAKEVAYLARYREHMDNDELQRFLAGESSFHDDLEEVEGFTPFTAEEETFLLQHHTADSKVLAEELDRDPARVRAKLKLMGLQDH